MPDSSTFQWAINLLIVQGLLGGFDTLYHHELTVDLPHRPGARRELRIHAIRALLYGVLFISVAHFAFQGLWALALAALVLVEVLLTLWDFVVEDRTRKLPASERVIHTILAINGGALFGLYGVQLVHWAGEPTALATLDLGWRGWLLTLFGVGVALSGLRDGFAARKLEQQVPTPNFFKGQWQQHILVTGGTGFIGEVLVNQLLDAGHHVTVYARDPLRAAYLFDGRARCLRSLTQLTPADRFDAIINLAGAPVLGPRWSPARKQQLHASRRGLTQSLVQWLNSTPQKPRVWIQASAIGAYGARGPEEALHEDSPTGTGFMAELCLEWEKTAQQVAAQGIRLVTLRLGVVFGPGGALPPLVLPHRFGLGGRLGNGKQVMSWIHRDDVLALIAEALQNDNYEGIYNTVSPEPISQGDFARSVGNALNRPVWLHLPALPIRLLAGEMAALFLDGQRVLPTRLQVHGFRFRYPELQGALRDLL